MLTSYSLRSFILLSLQIRGFSGARYVWLVVSVCYFLQVDRLVANIVNSLWSLSLYFQSSYMLYLLIYISSPMRLNEILLFVHNWSVFLLLAETQARRHAAINIDELGGSWINFFKFESERGNKGNFATQISRFERLLKQIMRTSTLKESEGNQGSCSFSSRWWLSTADVAKVRSDERIPSQGRERYWWILVLNHMKLSESGSRDDVIEEFVPIT